jgi:hypothetical protein
MLLLQLQKKVPKDIHCHHHHYLLGIDSVACFVSTVVFKISSYKFENATMKGVKTHLSFGKLYVMKSD